MFPSNSAYDYNDARLFLVKVKENGLAGEVTYIKGIKQERTRDTYLSFEDLKAGEYYLYTEIDWLLNTTDRSFVVTSYGCGGANF